MSQVSDSSTALKTPPLQITSAAVAEVLSSVKPGETIELNVRSSAPDGQALLYFKGQLLKAVLPELIQPGSVLLAQLVGTPSEPALALLQILPSPTEAAQNAAKALVEQLSLEIEKIFKESGLNLLLRAPAELQKLTLELPLLSQSFSNLQAFSPALATTAACQGPSELPEAVYKLVSQLRELESLLQGVSSAPTAEIQLESMVKGSFSDFLRAAAQFIREQIPQASLSPFERFSQQLRDEITKLLSRLDTAPSTESIERLIKTITQEVGNEHSTFIAREKDTLKNIARELRQALDEKADLAPKLKTVLSELPASPYSSTTPATQLDPAVQKNLNNIAQRLDTLASAQDTLNQLNPVMQALGEPALLLFPFILQGLLAHGEISINPYKLPHDKQEKRKGSDSKQDDDSERGDNTPYQQVQISVPLPGLGTVDVQLACRNKEILLHLNAETREAADFFQEQVQDLIQALATQEFSLKEFTSDSGGTNRGGGSAWQVLSDGTRKFVA